jgi:hypothetical protein
MLKIVIKTGLNDTFMFVTSLGMLKNQLIFSNKMSKSDHYQTRCKARS